MQADAVGIVVAGGRAARLGGRAGPGGKGALEVEGRSFLAAIVAALAAEVPRVIVVAAQGQPLPELPAFVEIVRDSEPQGGPLAALCDGLRYAIAAAVPPRRAVVLSCDVPLVRRAVVRRLLDLAAAPGVRWVVPTVDGHPQVLVSALDTGLLGRIEAHLAAGSASPRACVATLERDEPGAVRFVAAPAWRDVDPGLESFRDVDTPADLDRLRAPGIPSSPP